MFSNTVKKAIQLVAVTFFAATKSKKEGDSNNYHCFLRCNKTKEEKKGGSLHSSSRSGLSLLAPASSVLFPF
jgi:hypothetical protein